ncbi:MAG: VOC family protein [Nitrosopumilaceae archaeon]
MTKPIPDGFHSVTPTLTIRGAANAIEFYKKAFDAQEISRFPSPDGKIAHAQIKIGDSIVMLNDEFPQMNCLSPQSVGGPSTAIYLYVKDADAVFNKAVSCGAKIRMPIIDAFWGDRAGMLEDPFGHLWMIASRIIDFSPDELKKASQAASEGMAKHNS